MQDEAADSEAAAPDTPERLRSRLKSIVLVCEACPRRSKGPKRIGAKRVAKALRGACRDAGVAKPRIVLTSCLGACPKKAFTVAATGPGGDVTMLAFRRGDDANAAVAALFPGYSGSNSTSSAPSAT